jgi:hypothetical protein
MPVYKNISKEDIYLKYDNIVVKPNDQVTVKHFYKDLRLKLIDKKPYYLPFNISEVLEITSGNVKEYDVLNSTIINITVISGHIKVHLNENPCEKPVDLVQGLDVTLSNENKVMDKIIIEALEDSIVYIIAQSEDYYHFE